MRERQRWQTLVRLEVFKAYRGLPLKKAKVTLTRYSSGTPDFDGLVGSFKHVLDALVGAGLLIDDNPKVIGQPTYLFKKCSGIQSKVVVKVDW